MRKSATFVLYRVFACNPERTSSRARTLETQAVFQDEGVHLETRRARARRAVGLAGHDDRLGRGRVVGRRREVDPG